MSRISQKEQEEIISSFKKEMANKCELQDDILHISENSIEKISTDIKYKFKCFTSHETAHNFLLLIYSFIQIRPANIPLYGKLFLKVSTFLSKLISSQELMILYSSSKLIVLYLYEAGLIKIDDIIKHIKIDKQYMFYFCNEIRKEDSALFGNLVLENDQLEDFVLSVSPEEHDKKRRDGLNDGNFETQIREGLVPPVHPNLKVSESMYENSEFLTGVTFAEYAAYFGSLNAIKKYLAYINLNSSRILKYAIAGGQKEIVNLLLEQTQIKFKITHDCIRTAIDFQTTDDIDITVNVKEEEANETNITLTRFYTLSNQKITSDSQAKLSKYSSWNKSIYDNKNTSIIVNIKGKQRKNEKPLKGMKKYVNIEDIFLSMKKLNWHYFIDNLLYVSDQINDPCDEEQTTLLHFACFFGYKEVVKLLLSLYGDKNYFEHNYEDDTDLEHKPAALTRKSFINVNCIDKENRTPLHLAVLNQKVDNIKILMRCDDTDYHIQDIKGKTVIHYAAETKNRQIISIFFISFPNHDIDMNIPDKKGNTAFHYFCKPRCFDPKILKYVCSSSRINPNHLNHKNVTELMHSIMKRKRLEILKVLVESDRVDLNMQTPDKKQTALMIATKLNNLQAVQILMKDPSRIDPNLQNFKLRTALHIAVIDVSPECLQFLASQPNVNMNLVDDFELTPLFYSIYKRSYRLFEILLTSIQQRNSIKTEENMKNNFNFNGRDHFGQNLLNYTIRTQYFQSAKLFLKIYDINEPDSKGTSSFHQACATGKIEIIQLLVENLGTTDEDFNPYLVIEGEKNVINYKPGEKIKINMVDSNGMTPFHYACLSGSLTVVTFLFEIPGIKINEKNHRGESPFFLACKCNYINIVKFLLKSKQVNPYSTNFNGIPALSYLSEEDRKNVFL